MVSDIKLVPAHMEMADSYHRCLDSVAREGKHLYFLEAPPVKSSRDWMSLVLAAAYPFVLALDGTEVVGWCDIGPVTYAGFSHVGKLGMGVRQDYRCRGIGTGLLKTAIAMAGSLPLEKIELEVFASNEAAVRLYEKNGFEHEGRRKRARKVHGTYDDVLLMARFLTSDA